METVYIKGLCGCVLKKQKKSQLSETYKIIDMVGNLFVINESENSINDLSGGFDGVVILKNKNKYYGLDSKGSLVGVLESIYNVGDRVRVKNSKVVKELYPDNIGDFGVIVFDDTVTNKYIVKLEGVTKEITLPYEGVEPGVVVKEAWTDVEKSQNMGAQVKLKNVDISTMSDDDLKSNYGDYIIPDEFKKGYEAAGVIRAQHRPVRLIVDGKPIEDKIFTSSTNAIQWAMFKYPKAHYDLEYAD